MNMSYVIRPINNNDYKNYLELINDFRETTFTEEKFIACLEYINEYSKIFVIEFDSKLIATGTLIVEQKFIYNCSKLAHVEDVCVKKEFRGQGYGKLIVNELINVAKSIGCYKITLDCSETNVGFYETMNFEKRGNQMSQLCD